MVTWLFFHSAQGFPWNISRIVNYMPIIESVRSNRHWAIYGVVAVGVVISNFHQMSLAAISGDVATSLRADPAMLALLASAFAYPFSFMQVPAGILADTLGARKTVTMALLLSAVGTFLFGQASGVTGAIVARVLLGLGTAAILVPMMKLIAVWFPARDYAKLVAFALTISALGLLLATSPTAYANAFIGWRAIHFGLAVFTLGWAFLTWFVVRDRPFRVVAVPGEPAKTESAKIDPRWIWMALRTVLGSGQVWILGLWNCLHMGIYFAVIGLWGGQLLSGGMGFSAEATGLILTLPACSIMLSPLFTDIAARTGNPRAVLMGLSIAMIVLSIPFVFGLPALSTPLMTCYFIIFSIPTMAGVAVAYALAKEQFSVAYAGIVSGFANTFPLFGAALQQQTIGIFVSVLLYQGYSLYDALSLSFCIIVLAAVGGLVLAFFVRNPERRNAAGE